MSALDPLDEFPYKVRALAEPFQTRDARQSLREQARRRQRREALASTAFVVAMILIAIAPLVWAGIR